VLEVQEKVRYIENFELNKVRRNIYGIRPNIIVFVCGWWSEKNAVRMRVREMRERWREIEKKERKPRLFIVVEYTGRPEGRSPTFGHVNLGFRRPAGGGQSIIRLTVANRRENI